MENKKRPFTLTACIVNIVVIIVDLIMNIIGLDAVLGMADSYLYYEDMIVIFVFAIILDIAFLVFNNLLFSKWNKSIEVYKKFTWLSIVVFVLTNIFSLGAIISSNYGNFITAGLLPFTIMSAVFILLDHIKNKNLSNHMQYKQQEELKTDQEATKSSLLNEENKELTNNNLTPEKQNKTTNGDQLIKNLQSLQKMKNNKLITDAEYKKLKAKLFNDTKF